MNIKCNENECFMHHMDGWAGNTSLVLCQVAHMPKEDIWRSCNPDNLFTDNKEYTVKVIHACFHNTQKIRTVIPRLFTSHYDLSRCQESIN